ncbi:hypothetical protein E6P09_03225 [Haloferax mediterranei ATCC 33500]|uniref:Uncharacterized protein n=1 Tax=Haloferax mediterranei (strain ATCC 33500 / DSM 1411 / JCM 8866 / NBRC 14739 / NCIMB 2177 / R-4) TaxID=523841 RepID=I3R0L0_HALMT|nr:hypothetical protein [Haloferax mediterranei]AFK17770.1 hypothetical protein HFX_0026 [Haloferax mediterranei ATCC 33500]AHZ22798.1 hypothetical protein BM92_09155 [Haloferax mediterranei ATCC 33500]EMA02958.1 hypothetical protein C439_10255 [Haloferax mediterranei ATCC 33500]MDX5987859.1 hypothetical protein [Haloferax mediterranei ATCC 33500]QCQ74335.1 hypothetical protein E6P09_03225 [Haloferax mediterranei ATCC 33500]
MSRPELERASQLLKEAAEATDGEVQEQLYDQSDQLAKLATRDQGPDHGRLARHMTTLNDLAEEVDGDVEETVREARQEVLEYRKDVPGV